MAGQLVSLSDANAGWGTISYGSFTFPGIREAFSLRGEYVWDAAHRVIKYTRYHLRIHFFATHAAGSHAAAMVTLQRALALPRQTLTLSGMAFGTWTISGLNDLEFGVKPLGLETTQIGMLTHECVWECTFAIKDAASTPGAFQEFCYECDFAYDEAGLCTRTIAGFLEAFMVAPSVGTSIADTVDRYRDQIRVAVPVGFRRGSRNFKVSMDRRRLDFSIIDRQLDAEAPPPNCLRCDLDYEIESQPPGFARYTATLAGSIEVPSGLAPVRAAEAFMRVFIDRQQKLSRAVGNGGVAFPVKIRFGRGMGSRESRFGVSWMVTGCLDDLLQQGGIWEPITGVNWAAWAQTMAEAWGNRGTSNLMFSPTWDALVDVSRAGNLPQIQSVGVERAPWASGSSIFSCKDIPPEASWLFYENTLVPLREQRSVTHYPLEQYKPPSVADASVAGLKGVIMALRQSGTASNVTQYQGSPVDGILMRGKSMRFHHEPAIPRLVSVAGKRVQEVKTVYEGPKAVACIFGCTIYTARWAILYRLVDGYLGDIPELENPALCCADHVK